MKPIGVNGVEIAYLDEGSGPAVVIGHCSSASHKEWLPLIETLKPEYAQALRRVELDGVSVKDFAIEANVTPNNASVRLFRAREALRLQVERSCGTCAKHGCFDCTCANSACG